MTKIYDCVNRNILGYWELFTHDVGMYKQKNSKSNFRNQNNNPYVSSNIGFKNQDKGSYNHVSNNEIEKNSCEKLEDTVRQNDERLTRGRTKQ